MLSSIFERRFAGLARASRVPRRQRRGQYRGDPTRNGPLSIGDRVVANPDAYLNDQNEFKLEFTLHGLLIEAADPLAKKGDLSNPDRLDVFHELAASPPKPSVTGDTIDVMATRQFPVSSFSVGPATPFISKCSQVKKDSFGAETASYDKRIVQLMKYVDFVALNYAGGNY